MRYPNLWSAASALLALCIASPVFACGPSDFKARYALARGGFDVGEVITDFDIDEAGRYRYESFAKTTGLAALFSGLKIRQVSEGQWNAGGPQPDSYLHVRRDGDGVDRSLVRFGDPAIRVHNGETETLELPEPVYDPSTLSLLLVHQLRCTQLEDRYDAVTETGEERVFAVSLLDGGTEPALGREWAVQRIVRTQVGGGFRLVLHVAPDLNYMPIRIDWRNGDAAYRLRLQSRSH